MTRRATAILIAIILLSAALRFCALGSKSLWLDEIASVQRVRGTFGQMLREVIAHDGHPPLYYILQYAAKALGHSEAAARVPSALCGVALTGVVFLLGRRLFGESCGLAAAGLCAISGFQVFYSQEARHYELAALLGAASLWLFLGMLERAAAHSASRPPSTASTLSTSSTPTAGRETWALWLAYTLVGVAMLYTFYYLAFALLAEAAILAVAWRRARPVIGRWVISRAVVAVLFAPYLIVILKRISGLPPVPEQTKFDVLRSMPDAFVQMLTGLDPAALRFSLAAAIFVYVVTAAVIVVPLVVVFICGERRADDSSNVLVRGRHRKSAPTPAPTRLAFTVCILYLLIPVAAVLALPWRLQVFEAKHLVFVTPVLLVLAVWLPIRYRRPAAWLPVGLVAILNVYSLAAYYDPQNQKDRWPEACAVVHENVKPGDAILFNPEQLAYAFIYYYEHSGELIRVGNVGAIPPSGEPHRLWLIEERGSYVAVPDPGVEPAIQQRFRPAKFASGYAESQSETMLPGSIGSVVVKLYER